MKTRIFLLLSFLLLSQMVHADDIRVAVASNFGEAMKKIAKEFERATGQRVILIVGSTGKHYTQISHGAPFDAFFAADTLRPFLLEEEGRALPGTRFTYAVGKAILWSSDPNIGKMDSTVLFEGRFNHLAIANPRLAPYGKAAQEVLQHLGLWEKLQGRMVRGENIGQAYQYIKSGNAELGFVAYSQVLQPGQPAEGSSWMVPPRLYTPIQQQAVLLREHPAARAFLRFVQSEPARVILQKYGYELP